MISDALEIKNKKIITEDSRSLLFDSGNPFSSTETVTLENEIFGIATVASEIKNDDKPINDFFENQIEYILKSVNKFKDNPDILNNAGLIFLNQGNYNEATRFFSMALEIKPDSYSALSNIAKLNFKKGAFDEAIKIYRKIIDLFPADINVLQNLAHAYFNKKELKDSFHTLLEVIERDENNASAYNNLGVILIVQQEFKRAMTYLRKAIYINNNFANAYNNLGVCYQNLNLHKDAIKYFLIAVTLNRNFPMALKNLAISYQIIGDHEKVNNILNNYIVINGFDSECCQILGYSLIKLEQYEKASRVLKQALKDTSDSKALSRIYNNLGVVYWHLGKYDDSKENLEKSILQSPNPFAFNNLIDSYIGEHKTVNAIKLIEKAKELFTNDADLLVLEGKLFYLKKEYSNACECLQHALKLNPKTISAILLLSYIFAEIYYDYETSIQLVERGLKFDPKNFILLNNLAYGLLMLNRIQEAREILDSIDKTHFSLTATRGLLLIKEGNLKQGELLYNKAASSVSQNKELFKLINQKKFLELAKYFLHTQMKSDAVRYLEKARSFDTKGDVYLKQIEKIVTELFD